jgi:hypothetical protein
MIQKDLIKQLTAYRGPVLVETHNLNDVFWIQAVKSDLILQIKTRFGPDDETGFELDKNGYFGKDLEDDNQW